MAGNFADLTAVLTLDSTRFSEEAARVKKELGETSDLADLMAGRVSQSFNKQATAVEQGLSRQALAAQKAGISVGQYKAAMRMLPMQFTDVATQLAGGQNPWLILLQQGGQVKDSFGGMIPMFRGLAGAITLPMFGVTSLAVATGALAYAWYRGDATLSEFNKTLVLSGNQSGLTADRMLTLSRAGQAAGLTFNQASDSLAALVNAGVRGGEQFDAINQSVARFASASGGEVDKVAEAFGKLTTDPTSGLMAMARQFRNVTAEQIAYVAQLQRSGDEAGALQAANDIATKGFDEQTRRLKENMGTLETWADKTGKAFKSMWDAILDIGRPESSADMLASAQKAFDEADKKWQWYQSRSQRRGKTSSFRANLQGAWDDRENARLSLAAATLQSDMEKAGELAARDKAERDASQLKYTGEAQKAYERMLSPLDKYTARQKELNQALKDGKILQADYNTLMAAAKKDYESTLKKPSGVKVSAGERQEDRAHAALLALETELRTLEKHSGANEKISQQRRDLWKAENQYAVLKEAATKRQLSEQEKSLLAHEQETLEYKRQLAELGDKVEHQKRLNELANQAARFEQQQSAKQAAISAKARGLTDRQAQRESESQRLRDVYGDNPDALAKATSALKNTWSAEEQLRGSWMAGLKSGWGEWAESATDSFSQVRSAATQTFDGIAQNMAAMLTGSEQDWRGFTRSVLSMLTEIFLKQAMVGVVSSVAGAMGFAGGGFTGSGGKYEPAGIVHRGEFVFTKEATSRIGVGNLYRLMRGYAEGGYVGGAGSPVQMRRTEGINFNQNNHVVIQNDGTRGQAGPQLMKAVYDMARKGAQDEIQAQMRDGGVFSGGRR
ncbi:TPA: phage tail tape measure protein [Escherichia coli]|uniref:Phage tail tape measure protein n=3 Tax=Escherichia coli TaxID=562 RepID=A0A6D0Y6W0_ECOLX|nr:phage tail tape measure protein [Escherichia coli]EES7474577.1 phage tail tape measure protein [Escherichia coli]EEV9635675.1 phage tail tape measure protein [Escherichia coli]EFE5825623.1 phage tail tape measure protein [Escherichia coli]EFM5431056.1 phage tail tape measure protein [Escherichia coli]EFR9741025.1 phage tail tape measure protein [Escherichia coli]